MDHIDELVVKQKPELLPGIAKDVQKAVADIGKIKLFIFSAAVVPGRVGDRCAEGTNALIRSLKAQMVCSGADIAEILGWEAPAPSGKAVGQSLFAETGPLAPSVGNESAGTTGAAYREAVLPDSVAASAAGDGRVASLRGLLGDDPVSLDELSIRSGIAVAELPALLLELELAGRICALPGNLYMKN